jgi:conjugal transfer ATP-binding protein TraC
MNFFEKIKKKEKNPLAEEGQKAEQTKTNEGGKEKDFTEGLVSVKDIVAPSAVEVDFNHLRINNRYYRTLFAAGYPRFVSMNWLSTLINFDHSLNVSMHIYPTDGKEILDDLRRKIAEMEAELSTDLQRGRVINPSTKAKLEDALSLQEDLVKGEERFFQFGLYITVSAESKEELDQVTKALESSLGALLIITKKTSLQMEEGFKSCLPLGSDTIKVARNMDTTSLASTFPFVSSDLSDDKGIMYGINEHNGSLVIFDRFEMENYNSVIFATSGAGKSYLVKLEALRSLMFGTEVIVIDPENEYENLCEAVGGQYISFGYDEKSKINPFELSAFKEDEENELARKILSLHALFKIIMGKMNPEEEAILDRALVDSYKMKGITPDPETQDKEPPLIEDLYKALIGREETVAKSLAARLERFIKGSMMGIFNSQSTVDMKNKFVVFGIKNLEDSLRPVAMHVILDYIWNRIRKDMKKRLLIVDEAWLMMQHKDSANFLYGITKRARKYFLGVTTVTQDVDDFLNAEKGKAIVTNSALRVLLKQHTAAIDRLAEIFYLSEGEKQLLLSADVGEGIFFAGQNHVAIRVIASADEHDLITSKPEELLKIKAEREKKKEEEDKERKVLEQKRLDQVREKAALENRSANMEVEEERKEESPSSRPIIDLMVSSKTAEEKRAVTEEEILEESPNKFSQEEEVLGENEEGKKGGVVVSDLEEKISQLEKEEKERVKQLQEEGEKQKREERAASFGDGLAGQGKDLFMGSDRDKSEDGFQNLNLEDKEKDVSREEEIKEVPLVVKTGPKMVENPPKTGASGQNDLSLGETATKTSPVVTGAKQNPTATKTATEQAGFDYSKIAQEVWGSEKDEKEKKTGGAIDQDSSAAKDVTKQGKINSYDDLF